MSKGFIFKPQSLYFYALVAMVATNVIMCFTERMTPLQNLTSCVTMTGVYALLLTLPRKIGTAVWWHFPFIFFGAFNIVLLVIFGRGIIAVDMFLNLITTNPSEAGEVLGTILPGLTAVFFLFVPLLVMACAANKKGWELPGSLRAKFRKTAWGIIAASAVLLSLCHLTYKDYREIDKLFPVNAGYNMYLAIERTYQTERYQHTSKDFRFNARSERTGDEREIYVMLIGETARAINFGINGYTRNTTPLLGETDGIVSFHKAYSQSNTTHKSVPMLMSGISAANFADIIHQKSILTAFKESGYHTVYLSCQKHNRAYIDFFSKEADECEYLSDLEGSFTDFDCIPLLENAIAEGWQKLFVIIHCYGSHFSYRERYKQEDAVFLPDLPSEARPENAASLVNAYDNTIVMTDSLIHSVTLRLRESGAVCGMGYVSDHGENIFDDYRQRFLHASPLPSWYELRVPMILWFSPQFRDAYPQAWKAAQANRDSVVQTSESLFHTFLDIAGIRASIYDNSLSVTSSSYHAHERLYLTDRNTAVPYEELGIDDIDLENLDL